MRSTGWQGVLCPGFVILQVRKPEPGGQSLARERLSTLAASVVRPPVSPSASSRPTFSASGRSLTARSVGSKSQPRRSAWAWSKNPEDAIGRKTLLRRRRRWILRLNPTRLPRITNDRVEVTDPRRSADFYAISSSLLSGSMRLSNGSMPMPLLLMADH